MHSSILAVLLFIFLVNAASTPPDARCGKKFGKTCLSSTSGSCCSQDGWW
ncbi:hypothetical protein CGMCC3_g3824 [Colletotrichum fructicola]|nr:uncharacterized protein CGMCC3_g3824 [Colletotrichum fructicola]KAE9580163.1 hypothetical protein CGMCC3_g3824 [Colletotrichum fructicola]